MRRVAAEISSQYVIANSTVAMRHYSSKSKITDLVNKVLNNNTNTVTNERGTYKVTTLTPKQWEESCDKNLKAIIERDRAKRDPKN